MCTHWHRLQHLPLWRACMHRMRPTARVCMQGGGARGAALLVRGRGRRLTRPRNVLRAPAGELVSAILPR